MAIQVSFQDFLGLNDHRAPEVPIKPIPTIPITAAMPVWFSPKIDSPATITRAPIKHTIIPNAKETYCQRIIIPSFQTKLITGKI